MEGQTDLYAHVMQSNIKITQLHKENSNVKRKLEVAGKCKVVTALETQLQRAQERLKQQRDEFKHKDMKFKAKIEALEEKALQASQNYEETEIM